MSDEREIPPSESLLRRIHPVQFQAGAVTSAAFKCEDMSVNREGLKMSLYTTATVEQTVSEHPGHGVASLMAGDCAKLQGQVTVADPIPLNDAHGLVRGKKTISVAKALKALAVLRLKPSEG